MGHLLSKSKYIRGLQCDRALWLDVYNPRLAKYTREQMQRFDRGREFEYAFKDTFPNGIDISAELKRNVDAYPNLTAMYLDKEEVVSDASTETVLFAEMPIKTQLKITYTEPGVKGDTATNTLKPATVETGATVRVPLFIDTDEIIEVDTRDGSYVGRVR